ncbi:hypothetical protein ABEF95_008717 [Exophiala dermatitidis]
MPTLFDNTGLPLWVYIVLIVVGSVLLLVTVAILLRCWIVRRRPRPTRLDNLTTPTRRMTLRRGRLVPTSQHLSLTGSKFGVRQFGVLTDNESTATGRRSPFEWWNTIMDRSPSRQDQMSQVETGSIGISTRPESFATTTAGRRESLADTSARTPEKGKEPIMTSWEVTLPSPPPSPGPDGRKPINFSRSFSTRTPSSPLAQRSQLTLSRISERSPHNSMISTSGVNQFHLPLYHTLGRLENRASAVESAQYSPLTLTIPVAAAQSTPVLAEAHLDSPSPVTSKPWSSNMLSASYTTLPATASFPTNSPRPHTADAATFRQYPYLQQPPPIPTSRAPTYHRRGTSWLSSEEGPTFYRQSNSSHQDLSRHSPIQSATKGTATPGSHHSRQSSANLSMEHSGIIVYETQLPDYWSTRPDMQDLAASLNFNSCETDGPARNDSTPGGLQDTDGKQRSKVGVVTVPGKKNSKVLRKKSLSRTRSIS